MTFEFIVSRIRRIYPEIAEVVALQLVNDVNHELHERYPIKVVRQQLALVANQREYTLDPTWMQILEVDFVQNANNEYCLAPTDMHYLTEMGSRWHQQSPGKPRSYYVWAGQGNTVLGLLPPPNQTTTAGFPHVRIHASMLPEADVGLNDEVPDAVPRDGRIYSAGAAYLWAKENVLPELPAREKEWIEEMGRTERFIYRRNARWKPRMVPTATMYFPRPI